MAKNKLLFLTGAGISQPSGIRTFRGDSGLWNDHKIQDVATLSAFRSDPERVINFMNEINLDLKDKKPNYAHYAIAALEEKYDVIVVTQNIDTLHEQAGSSNVIHLHGRHDQIKCMDCQFVENMVDPFLTLNYGSSHCSRCHSKNIKQNIVLFEEKLDENDFNLAYSETYDADLFIQIGTSALVSPACNLVKHAKPERKRVEMNLERSHPKSKDRFMFRHYYLGDIVNTIDYFISDLPKLLPICRRSEFKRGDNVKDKDRYNSQPIILTI